MEMGNLMTVGFLVVNERLTLRRIGYGYGETDDSFQKKDLSSIIIPKEKAVHAVQSFGSRGGAKWQRN